MCTMRGPKVRGAAVLAAVLTAFGLSAATAGQVKLSVALGTPFLSANKKQMTYLKVGLTGFDHRKERRTPVNVAIVIDRSGSMSGEKIQRAKEAAMMAIGRLGRDDIVSVVAYDDTIRVLVPATKVYDKDAIYAAIQELRAGATTALFAGVSRGASEVRKFLDKEHVNRVILLSDGLANVGPSSAAELGELGASLIKEGISVTTIGIGLDYNEDLMTRLAQRSDGNHYFAERAGDLSRFFDGEFGDVLSVVAQEIVVRIRCAEGIRPVRVLGREGEIDGQTVLATLNQLYGSQEKYIILEVEVPATPAGLSREVASVGVSYVNMATMTTDKLTNTVAVRFTNSERDVEKNLDAEVMVPAAGLVATDNNERALKLRDEGKVEEARRVLLGNVAYLKENADRYQSEKLRRDATANESNAQNLDGERWARERKLMRASQHQERNQQAVRE